MEGSPENRPVKRQTKTESSGNIYIYVVVVEVVVVVVVVIGHHFFSLVMPECGMITSYYAPRWNNLLKSFHVELLS